jgi:hypothetical protein
MAGYSGTPLVKKLGLREGHRAYIHGAPPEYFDWLNPFPEEVEIKEKLSGELDFVHLFVSEKKLFETLFVKAKKYLKKDGMLWVSWPKKSAKVPTDLDENIIRNFGLKEGLVDVKVCAVSEIWSGLKFMVRVKDR